MEVGMIYKSFSIPSLLIEMILANRFWPYFEAINVFITRSVATITGYHIEKQMAQTLCHKYKIDDCQWFINAYQAAFVPVSYFYDRFLPLFDLYSAEIQGVLLLFKHLIPHALSSTFP